MTPTRGVYVTVSATALMRAEMALIVHVSFMPRVVADPLAALAHCRLRIVSIRDCATVAASFTWERCGTETVVAYEHVLS